MHSSLKTDHVDVVVPVIEMGYFYLTDGTEDQQTGLIAICRSTGYTFATVVTEKGTKFSYAVAAMASWMRETGHSRCILQSDGEPSLVAFRNAVREKVLAEAPPGT